MANLFSICQFFMHNRHATTKGGEPDGSIFQLNRKTIFNTPIFELSEEEILVISGSQGIDPPEVATTTAVIYPEVENNPPG